MEKIKEKVELEKINKIKEQLSKRRGSKAPRKHEEIKKLDMHEEKKLIS